MKRSIFNK